MSFAVDFTPLLQPLWFWLAVTPALLLAIYSFVARARGAWARTLVVAVAILILAHPLIVQETRAPLSDIVALVVDHSQSMSVGNRRASADRAAAVLRQRIAADKTLELRERDIVSDSSNDEGTKGFAALHAALADVPPERIAGAIMITDGEVHDTPSPNHPALRAPLHALIAGQRNEHDRKLTIVSAPRFTIVGQRADIILRVDDFGGTQGGIADVDLRIDGSDKGIRHLTIGHPQVIAVPVTHGGENVVELEAKPGPAELTLENNRAVVTISGVRDRLRVMLVSGEPHAGERVWRNLLKADPAVDLVHFTILRPPEKQLNDPTPINELSLIAFPTRQLFVEKLHSFDLVIFDRYRERGILPLAYFENIARYVEDGGALLVSSGSEFAQEMSIYRTPLAAVLPARPTGEVVQQGYRPMVTAEGLAHPVTQNLPGENTAAAPPTWGRWFRLIGTEKVAGETVMSGPGNKPLLVLDRFGKGRVAELLSDQPWLWARGFEGGGPEAELLRRLAHWLMKEPELEEERLTAAILNGKIVIERRTMAPSAKPVTLTMPSGRKSTLMLQNVSPGLWRAAADAGELGLYRVTDGLLSAVAAAGPLNPKEVADTRATDSILAPQAITTGGSVHWLTNGLPSIRRVSKTELASGTNWIGLRRNGAYRVTAVQQQALLPSWLALVLLVGTLLLAWRIEGR